MGNGDGATAQIIVVEHGESGQSCGNRWCGSKFGLDPFGIRKAFLREPADNTYQEERSSLLTASSQLLKIRVLFSCRTVNWNFVLKPGSSKHG